MHYKQENYALVQDQLVAKHCDTKSQKYQARHLRLWSQSYRRLYRLAWSYRGRLPNSTGTIQQGTEKMKNFIVGILSSLLLVTVSVSANEGERLAKQNACTGCHTTKHIGISYPPAFEKLAEKYQNNSEQIKHSIRYGKGKMPAHPVLTETEINLLTEYILTFGDKK